MSLVQHADDPGLGRSGMIRRQHGRSRLAADPVQNWTRVLTAAVSVQCRSRQVQVRCRPFPSRSRMPRRTLREINQHLPVALLLSVVTLDAACVEDGLDRFAEAEALA